MCRPVTVCVVGSINMDLVVKVHRLPEVGETVTDGTFSTFPGGKGANQAVAAARLGARVAMIGRVGRDAFGAVLREALAANGVDVNGVGVDPEEPTGVACIGVDRAGRNLILVAPGANRALRPAHLDTGQIQASRVVLLQLEIPVATVLDAARAGKVGGALVCLDPAPACPLPDELWELVDVLTPNQVEARLLTGQVVDTIDDAYTAAQALRERGPRAVVVKLGEQGAVYVSAQETGHLPALPVKAVDTTAAGDVFTAALAVRLAESCGMEEAVRFANCAAGLKVTRMGAQSMPDREEVDRVLGGQAGSV